MEWFFALTTVFFACLAAYLSFKGEKSENKIKSEERAASQRLHMVVHELRAPITAIKGASSLLLSKKIAQQEQDKMLHVIFDSSREMLSRISEILDSAQVEEGRFVVRKVKSDLSVIIREHIELFSYAAAEKGIRIIFHPVLIPQFYFDPGRIGQVINNLISNSLKFTKQGGTIEVKIQEKEGKIEVCVEDNGVGIPENKRAFLFTKFGQISNPKDPATNGAMSEGSSGLGLYISKQIVESHGGKIWIESREGGGTKAFFTLPFVQEERIPSEGRDTEGSVTPASPGV